jgi:hypothetical protein
MACRKAQPDQSLTPPRETKAFPPRGGRRTARPSDVADRYLCAASQVFISAISVFWRSMIT